jgi:hypothetical protein
MSGVAAADNEGILMGSHCDGCAYGMELMARSRLTIVVAAQVEPHKSIQAGGEHALRKRWFAFARRIVPVCDGNEQVCGIPVIKPPVELAYDPRVSTGTWSNKQYKSSRALHVVNNCWRR